MESGNDYVIQLKSNCRSLKSTITSFIKDKVPASACTTTDKGRGRKDNRSYKVYCLKDLELKNGWNHIRSITVVERSGIRHKQQYRNSALYISSLLLHAKEMSKGIRGHWTIENTLHRTKDVIQLEDKNYIKNKTLACNVSILQTLAISILRLNKINSLKFGNEKYHNKVKESLILITKYLRI
mgnify:CR=1 FL=1